jgi:hypothetical protein
LNIVLLPSNFLLIEPAPPLKVISILLVTNPASELVPSLVNTGMYSVITFTSSTA